MFLLQVDLNDEKIKGLGHTSIPLLRKGKVGGQFWANFDRCISIGKDAVRDFIEQNDVIKRFIQAYPETFKYVTTADGILEAHKEGKIASLIGKYYTIVYNSEVLTQLAKQKYCVS